MTDGNTMLIENSGGNTIQRGLIKIIIMPFKNISIFLLLYHHTYPLKLSLLLSLQKQTI